MTDLLGLAFDQPMFAIGITVAAYAIAEALWQCSGRSTFLNPVLVATCLVAGFILFFGISYSDDLQEAQPINETLALLIVLLSVSLCRQFRLLKQAGLLLTLALVFGSVVAIFGALLYPLLAGADAYLLATSAPKPAITAVAVEITDRLGGIPGLTAVTVLLTGIFGAAFGPSILERSTSRTSAQGGFLVASPRMQLAPHGHSRCPKRPAPSRVSG